MIESIQEWAERQELGTTICVLQCHKSFVVFPIVLEVRLASESPATVVKANCGECKTRGARTPLLCDCRILQIGDRRERRTIQMPKTQTKYDA